MIHFNRKTEYALIAMEHMIRKDDLKDGSEEVQVTSAREISEAYQVPYALLAKVLQKLAGRGLVKSVHGTKGGYVLAKNPQEVSVMNIMEIFEGSPALAECFKEERITCPQWDGCRIKHPLAQLNHKIYHLLADTSVAHLVAGN